MATDFDHTIEEMVQRYPHLKGMSIDKLHNLILKELSKSNVLTDEVKKLISEVSFVIAAYCVTGKISKSFAPVGAVVAEKAFLANVGFFSGLWYAIVGVPAWVGALGAVAGAGAGILIAPVIGGIVEYGINRFREQKLIGKFEEGIENIRMLLLEGGKHSGNDFESVVANFIKHFRELSETVIRLRRAFEKSAATT